MTKKIFGMISMAAIMIILSQNAFAESVYEEKLEFASALEEALGHFWALEKNIDEGNVELALVHATHPIAELYNIIKPELNEHDSVLDSKMQAILMALPEKTNADTQELSEAIAEANQLVEEARLAVVGEELSSDVSFQLDLMKGLVHTAEVEYEEAVSDGMIHEMAEYQDGSAFVWRSEQIFHEIRAELPEHESEEIEEFFTDLKIAFEQKQEPESVEVYIDGIIHEINEIKGEEHEEDDLLEYVENIENLLNGVKTEYQNGNKDEALSLATKAYLDNFEFLEGPLEESGNEELMREVEEMMREELRNMIKEGASSEEINQKVDSILEKMGEVKVAVPEFGSIVTIALVIAIIGVIVATSNKTGLSLISRR